MAAIYIDGKVYDVKPGKNLLETCLTLGFNLPYFCCRSLSTVRR